MSLRWSLRGSAPPAAAVLWLAATTSVSAQSEASDPITLVGRAEESLAAEQPEDATLLLWRALAQMPADGDDPIAQATRQSAVQLLERADPLTARRRRALTTVAKEQVEVARRYRVAKWFDTASRRLDVAARFDPAVTVKERRLVEARRERAGAGTDPTTGSTAGSASDRLTDRAATVSVVGEWQDGAVLRTGPRTGKEKFPAEWIVAATHADHEIGVEVRADDPDGEFNYGIGLGFRLDKPGYRCLRLQCFHYDDGAMQVVAWEIEGERLKELAKKAYFDVPRFDEFHTLTVRVQGAEVVAKMGGLEPFEFRATAPVRGNVSVLVGSNTPTSGMQFRNLRIDPLPSAEPTAAERRARQEDERRAAITAAVEAANAHIEAERPEPAARRFREALALVRQLPDGVLTTNLRSSIQESLAAVDRVSGRRDKAAVECGSAFAGLAEAYLTAGRPRLALVVARQATSFDPEGQREIVRRAEAAVKAWNAEQVRERTAELAPPPDDGTLLREWFAGGQLLDPRGRPWTIAGPAARVEGLRDSTSMWMPKSKTLARGECSIHVRLPAAGCFGGFVFDAAGQHDFSVALVRRDQAGLTVFVSRWAGGRWLELADRTVKLDAWRLEAWHELRLLTGHEGVRLAVGATELNVPRARLGLSGPRLGLAAGTSSDEPQAVEFRAFVVRDAAK